MFLNNELTITNILSSMMYNYGNLLNSAPFTPYCIRELMVTNLCVKIGKKFYLLQMELGIISFLSGMSACKS